MTNFEKFATSDIDTLARFLDKHGAFDDSPWMKWFDVNYCKRCESVKLSSKESVELLGFDPWYYHGEVICGYCEVHHKCKFFPDLDYIPDNEDIIRMWLKVEVEE